MWAPGGWLRTSTTAAAIPSGPPELSVVGLLVSRPLLATSKPTASTAAPAAATITPPTRPRGAGPGNDGLVRPGTGGGSSVEDGSPSASLTGEAVIRVLDIGPLERDAASGAGGACKRGELCPGVGWGTLLDHSARGRTLASRLDGRALGSSAAGFTTSSSAPQSAPSSGWPSSTWKSRSRERSAAPP